MKNCKTRHNNYIGDRNKVIVVIMDMHVYLCGDTVYASVRFGWVSLLGGVDSTFLWANSEGGHPLLPEPKQRIPHLQHSKGVSGIVAGGRIHQPNSLLTLHN